MNDVEKRWYDAREMRAASLYAVSVAAAAVVAMIVLFTWANGREACAAADTALCDDTASVAILLVPGGLLIAGGIGAFVRTYRVWRRGGTWVIWQGAGWFLFVMSLLYMGIAVGAVAR